VKNEHCDDRVASKEILSIPVGGSLAVAPNVGGEDESVRVLLRKLFGPQGRRDRLQFLQARIGRQWFPQARMGRQYHQVGAIPKGESSYTEEGLDRLISMTRSDSK
jgi:hypothetical protein